jgi:hypothetical protein
MGACGVVGFNGTDGLGGATTNVGASLSNFEFILIEYL